MIQETPVAYMNNIFTTFRKIPFHFSLISSTQCEHHKMQKRNDQTSVASDSQHQSRKPTQCLLKQKEKQFSGFPDIRTLLTRQYSHNNTRLIQITLQDKKATRVLAEKLQAVGLLTINLGHYQLLIVDFIFLL